MKTKQFILLGLTSLFIVALFLSEFAGILSTVEASRPIQTAFYRESIQVWDNTKVLKFVNYRIIVKSSHHHQVIDEGVDETIDINVVWIVDIQTWEAQYRGSFVITSSNGDTIHGRLEAKTTNFDSGPILYVSEGTFVGGGYMNVRGTLSKATGSDTLVWEGISW